MNNPRLRFTPTKERTYPDYTPHKLKDLCEIRREVVDISKQADTRFLEYSMPAFDAGCNPKVICGAEVKSGRVPICGDVLLFNKLNVSKKRIWNIHNSPNNSVCSAEFMPVTTLSVLQDYLYYIVSTDKFTKSIEGSSSGTSNSQKRITPSVFLEQWLSFPCHEEQRRIAEFFTTLDKNISLVERKLASMERLKKGLMQKIFSKEIRFKRDDGMEFPEWKSSMLKERLDLLKDGTHGSFKDSLVGYPLLSAKNIDGMIRIPRDSRLISEFDYRSIYSTYTLTVGDVLLTIVGSIGRSAIVSLPVPKVAFQRSVAILRPGVNILSEFLNGLIQSNLFQKHLKAKTKAGAQCGVYLGDIGNILIDYPSDIEEQRKIASFLTTLDEKIALSKRKITELKRQKQAFLQQMFV